MQTPVNTAETALKIKELELRLEVAKQRLSDRDEQLAEVKEDRDRWRQQATALLPDPKRSTENTGLLRRLFGREKPNSG
ncbi:hypothetical protein JM93_03510 [Roseibium hamelinense]|uniref:Uncharacterized protein n=1 Tax=Roseibium hamelinense TaxID=150831 RepID=A0A562SNC8_9HYPH|nr:hypothetical protein [Roseibium hamelinense]MTI44906.1 hypothetical protein [Roseibium hamelinense]TWI82166.1 hypothetical protein JM93_03510 [Roseibium hamelinense]